MLHQIEYNPNKDYYSLLGIRPDSGSEDIKITWKKKAFELHPDTKDEGRGTKDEDIRDINEAYSILKDPEKRKVYDRKRALYIAKTFKFKDGRLLEHYVPDIEPQLQNDKPNRWYKHIFKSFLSKISKKPKT